MKIFLITDIHYGENTNYPKHGGLEYINQFGELFKNFFPHLREEMEACDLVMNLGDFIHDESTEKDIETFKSALSFFLLKTPVRHVFGNHDAKNISREQWSQLVGEENSYYSFDLGGYHHIVLDGNRTEPRGPLYIPEEQLKWLEGDLDKTSLTTVVYSHFPMDNQSMDSNYYFKDKPENASLGNKYFVRRILEKSGKVVAVFSGHTHFYNEQSLGGITYWTVPSFSENDGNNQPNGKYAIVTLTGNQARIEIKVSAGREGGKK